MKSSDCSISLKRYAIFAVAVSSRISNDIVATESMEWLFAHITCGCLHRSLWFHWMAIPFVIFFWEEMPCFTQTNTVSICTSSSSFVASAVVYIVILAHSVGCCCFLFVIQWVFDISTCQSCVFYIKSTCPSVVVVVPSLNGSNSFHIFREVAAS